MTGIAIFNPESLASVVAGTAGLTYPHIIHGGHSVRATACLEQAGMTFVTAEHVKMERVRKDRSAETLVNNIAGMTTRAILLDTEGIPAVMTGPARGTGFHRRHPHLIAIRFSPEQIGMTITATEHLGVHTMAERGDANIPRLDRHINGLCVTSNAIACDPESGTAIMTCAA